MFIVKDGVKHDIPEAEPTNNEFKALLAFAYQQQLVPDVFLYSTVLHKPAERAALHRLADKGWLEREQPDLAKYRMNEAAWWFCRTFVPDDD